MKIQKILPSIRLEEKDKLAIVATNTLKGFSDFRLDIVSAIPHLDGTDFVECSIFMSQEQVKKLAILFAKAANDKNEVGACANIGAYMNGQ